MTNSTLSLGARRFLRTLRVASATAIAGADHAGALRARPSTSFLALAAKGRGEWRFPADGLISADGLVRAKLSGEAGARALELQALGAAGLTRYARAPARLTLASGLTHQGVFDRDGALAWPLPADVAEADLAGFELELASGAS